MNDAPHTLSLAAKHAGLDQRLLAESRRPAPDASLIASLKKQKLKLKEEMER